MAEKSINPILKQALELGPMILFFAGFFLLEDKTYTVFGQEFKKFILLTACFIPLTLAALAATWFLSGTLSRMQVFGAVLVVVLGGVSVWLNDERYIMMKPTALYLAFATALFIGLARGQSYLRSLMGTLLLMQDEGWMILTRRFAYFFLGMAIMNEIVWRNFSQGTWLSFKLFGITAATFLFFIAQYKIMEKYGLSDKTED